MNTVLSELEIDALKEMMNIGFGRAAGELSDILKIHVLLSVPEIHIFKPDELSGFITESTTGEDNYSVVRQFFIGGFKGFSLLALPLSQSRAFFACFCENEDLEKDVSIDLLEQETLLEIGNIIVGACVGEIANILKDMVRFSPPEFFVQSSIQIAESSLFKDNQFVLSFKTRFQLEEQDVFGFLFLVTDFDTIKWLKEAISDFLKQYES